MGPMGMIMFFQSSYSIFIYPTIGGVFGGKYKGLIYSAKFFHDLSSDWAKLAGHTE